MHSILKVVGNSELYLQTRQKALAGDNAEDHLGPKAFEDSALKGVGDSEPGGGDECGVALKLGGRYSENSVYRRLQPVGSRLNPVLASEGTLASGRIWSCRAQKRDPFDVLPS